MGLVEVQEVEIQIPVAVILIEAEEFKQESCRLRQLFLFNLLSLQADLKDNEITQKLSFYGY